MSAAMTRPMTKSALALARSALSSGEEALARYAHRYSPRKFTQAQLFAALVVRKFFDLDYRGLAQLLHDWSDLRECLGFKQLPHFTTFQKAEVRLLKKKALPPYLIASLPMPAPAA